MKQVIECYGSMIVAVLAALAVIGFWMNFSYEGKTGVAEVMGSYLEESATQPVQEDAFRMFRGYRQYMRADIPQIRLQENYALVKGAWTDINTVLWAVGRNGHRYPVWIEEAWQDERIEGTETTGRKYAMDSEGCRICFRKAGRFWLKVATTGPTGRMQEALVQVVVNERRLE